jgi:hypothetical protein
MYAIKNKNVGSTSCMCIAHILMVGVAYIAIFFNNLNVIKCEHEMNTQYKHIYHPNQNNLFEELIRMRQSM